MVWGTMYVCHLFSRVQYINMLVCFQANVVHKSVLFSLVMKDDFLQNIFKVAENKGGGSSFI